MKKIIFSAVLSVMSAVAFAQGEVPNANSNAVTNVNHHKNASHSHNHHYRHHKAHHSTQAYHGAKLACKNESGRAADKKVAHEEFKQCMHAKGFMHSKHYPKHHGKHIGHHGHKNHHHSHEKAINVLHKTHNEHSKNIHADHNKAVQPAVNISPKVESHGPVTPVTK